MSTVDHLYQAILALPDTERFELLERLAVPVPASSTIFGEAWRSEIARRRAALNDGSMGTQPWDEVREEVKQRYSDDA